MKPIDFHPEANAEFGRAIRYYDSESASLGAEFADSLELAVEFIRANPEAGTPLRGALRRWLVRRFPYAVIYREEAERLYVLAVAHQRQKPEYWQHRV